MRLVHRFQWLHTAVAVAGFALALAYLIHTGDWRLSPAWSLVFPLISFSVAWATGAPKLHARFPLLNQYSWHRASSGTVEAPLTDKEWTTAQVNYLLSLFRGKGVALTPGEDGLICVPILLVGINPLSALLGGAVFGLMHLGRFTFLECIAKSVTYALVCYFVLPHGLLTVVLGHIIMNGAAFVALRVVKRQMERLQAVERKLEARSNTTVETDARKSGARGSP
jgi:hypothetical protein